MTQFLDETLSYQWIWWNVFTEILKREQQQQQQVFEIKIVIDFGYEFNNNNKQKCEQKAARLKLINLYFVLISILFCALILFINYNFIHVFVIWITTTKYNNIIPENKKKETNLKQKALFLFTPKKEREKMVKMNIHNDRK